MNTAESGPEFVLITLVFICIMVAVVATIKRIRAQKSKEKTEQSIAVEKYLRDLIAPYFLRSNRIRPKHYFLVTFKGTMLIVYESKMSVDGRNTRYVALSVNVNLPKNEYILICGDKYPLPLTHLHSRFKHMFKEIPVYELYK